MAGLPAPILRANELLLRHPVSAGLLVGAFVLLVARGVLILDEDSSASGWWTVGLFAFIAWGALDCLLVPRFLGRPADEVISISWMFALAPSLLAATATLGGLVETWTFFVAALVSAASLVITMRTALTAHWARGE